MIGDILVNDQGHFRYLVIDVQLEEIDKMVLLPIGLAQLDYRKGKAVVSSQVTAFYNPKRPRSLDH